jgi:hypothetical protein
MSFVHQGGVLAPASSAFCDALTAASINVFLIPVYNNQQSTINDDDSDDELGQLLIFVVSRLLSFQTLAEHLTTTSTSSIITQHKSNKQIIYIPNNNVGLSVSMSLISFFMSPE